MEMKYLGDVMPCLFIRVLFNKVAQIKGQKQPQRTTRILDKMASNKKYSNPFAFVRLHRWC